MEYDEIIDHLVVRRYELALSQKAVARKINMSHESVSAWELGRRNPTGDHLIAWARALGYSIDLIPITDSANSASE